MMVRVAIIATGTWVHRCNEHERARELYIVFGTADGDDAIFEWLTQHFENATRQLGHLVKKEYAVVGK